MCVFSGHTHKELHIPSLALPIPRDLPEGIIIGWRHWEMYGGILQSPSQGTKWDADKPLKAHRISNPENSGVYAYVGEESGWRSTGVNGEVALWGKVWEHSKGARVIGYTAEYAYPLSLFVGLPSLAKILAKTWGKKGVYINLYSPGTPGADSKGYIEYA